MQVLFFFPVGSKYEYFAFYLELFILLFDMRACRFITKFSAILYVYCKCYRLAMPYTCETCTCTSDIEVCLNRFLSWIIEECLKGFL